MTLDDLYAQVPRLRASAHRITSPATDDYNCVAWVDRDLDHWWEPGILWPRGLEPAGDEDLEAYVAFFEQWGYTVCDGPEYEVGYLKIAIYARDGEFHHVAKQLPSGKWSSKAGTLHDFLHESLEAVEGVGLMNHATAVVFMRRAHDADEDFTLEETGLMMP